MGYRDEARGVADRRRLSGGARVLLAVAGAFLLLCAMRDGVPSAAGAPVPVPADAAGPHDPLGRRLAPTVVRRVPGATVRWADFGAVTLGRTGRFRAPVRGLLVTPRGPARRAPLVVVAHLRYPGCPGQVFAFPCPSGGTPLRLDAGMAYLGVALARAGYAVLIPDLGPLYVGADIDRPYDQRAGFSRTVAALVARARAGARGEPTRWGAGLRGRIAPGALALIAHSRSGPVALATARAWRHSPHPVRSVLIYGGALEPGDRGVDGSPPPPPDVPVLALVGTEDRDTDWMAAAWLSAHIAQPRRAPALVATVPGLGHTLVNRTLARRGIDDRICAGGCASAAEHRGFLTAAARAWLGATGAERTDDLPVRGTDPLPVGLAGRPVRWVAVTNGPRRMVFVAGQRGTARPFGPLGRAAVCFPPEPMAPARAGDCPLPERAVGVGTAAVARIRVGPESGVVVTTPPVSGARDIAVHLAPTDDRTDGRRANPLRVEARFGSGRSVAVDLDGHRAALADRANASASGVYAIGTLRLALPEWARAERLTAVALSGGDAVSAFDLRAIDVAR